MRKVSPAIEAFGADFFGELLVETEIRAKGDASFAKTLDGALAEIDSLASNFAPLENKGRAVFAIKNGGLGDCAYTVEAHNSQTGQIQVFCIESGWDCLLLYLGIIIVIFIVIVAG